MMQQDIEALSDPTFVPDLNNTVYIVFLLIGIIGFLPFQPYLDGLSKPVAELVIMVRTSTIHQKVQAKVQYQVARVLLRRQVQPLVT